MLKEAMPDQGLAYQKSRQAEQNLELPPDLKGANFDDAMDVPPIAGGATYSEYADGRAQRRQASPSGAGAILPTVENVELRRSGDSRWLEVQAAPQQVWPRVVAFWREQGILLVDQNPAVGVMKTDWIENRAEVCLLPPRPGQPDLVFTANAALIYRDLAVPARFRHGERRGVRRAALLHDRRYFSDRKWRR